MGWAKPVAYQKDLARAGVVECNLVDLERMYDNLATAGNRLVVYSTVDLLVTYREIYLSYWTIGRPANTVETAQVRSVDPQQARVVAHMHRTTAELARLYPRRH